MNGLRRAVACSLLAASLVLGAAAGCSTVSPRRGTDAPETSPRGPATSSSTDAADRIRYYSGRIAASPRLYPMYTQLGLALLDRARETHDPGLLAAAREAEAKALAIQDNYESLVAMATIENYSHRFDDAIRFGERAAAASTSGEATHDPAVAAILVEALLGAGRSAEARRLLPSTLEGTTGFGQAAAMARWLAENGRGDEAAEAWVRAAGFALDQADAALAAWAQAAAAGAFLDQGKLREALPHLDEASRLAPPSTFLQVHRAELAQARNDPREALAILEAILENDADPAVHSMAFTAAKRSGDPQAAQSHFRAAEDGFRRAIAAGEVHTLGALAGLYLEAGVRLDEARRLATENLEWKRDRAAVDLLDRLRAR